MEKYKKGESIGNGCYGVVYKGLECETNQTVAIKKMYTFDVNDGIPGSVIREISLLREMNHDNIVKLLDVAELDNEWYFISEYLDLDLDKFMEIFPEDAKDPPKIKKFLHQILSGVTYGHKRKIMHRDLKPSNLLLDLNASVLRIADFGLAREFETPYMTCSPEVVTLWYRPPEILLGSPVYTTAVDVWSVGCIFAEMITHEPLFPSDSKTDQLHTIFSIMGTPDEGTWPGVTSLRNYSPDFPKYNPQNLAKFVPSLEPAGVDLLSEMLCMDPARRILAVDALEHAFFKDDNGVP